MWARKHSCLTNSPFQYLWPSGRSAILTTVCWRRQRVSGSSGTQQGAGKNFEQFFCRNSQRRRTAKKTLVKTLCRERTSLNWLLVVFFTMLCIFYAKCRNAQQYYEFCPKIAHLFPFFRLFPFFWCEPLFCVVTQRNFIEVASI